MAASVAMAPLTPAAPNTLLREGEVVTELHLPLLTLPHTAAACRRRESPTESVLRPSQGTSRIVSCGHGPAGEKGGEGRMELLAEGHGAHDAVTTTL